MSELPDDETLPPIGLAAELDDDDRQKLSTFGEFTTVDKRTVVIQEGTPQRMIYLVLSGMLHVQTGSEAQPTLLARLRTGDTFGEINIFDPHNASATIIAVEETRLWSIDKERLESFLNENSELATAMLIHICTQLSLRARTTNEKLSVAREAMAQSMYWL